MLVHLYSDINDILYHYTKIKYVLIILVSRTFRLAITLGVGLAVVSTIALIVVLIRHQKTIRKATREMQFQRLAAMNSSQYADEPKELRWIL